MFGKVGRADTATDPAPYSMAETTVRPPAARGLAPGRAQAAGTRGGLLPRCGASSAGSWPESRPETTPELVDAARSGHALARLGQRVDGARARPHGHDGHRRADAGGHARRGARPGAPRRPRHARCAPSLTRVPGTRSAVFESQGGETVADLRPRSRARSPDTTSIPTLARSDGRPAARRGASSARSSTTGGACGVRIAPDVNMPMMMPGPGMEPLRGPRRSAPRGHGPRLRAADRPCRSGARRAPAYVHPAVACCAPSAASSSPTSTST